MITSAGNGRNKQNIARVWLWRRRHLCFFPFPSFFPPFSVPGSPSQRQTPNTRGPWGHYQLLICRFNWICKPRRPRPILIILIQGFTRFPLQLEKRTLLMPAARVSCRREARQQHQQRRGGGKWRRFIWGGRWRGEEVGFKFLRGEMLLERHHCADKIFPHPRFPSVPRIPLSDND